MSRASGSMDYIFQFQDISPLHSAAFPLLGYLAHLFVLGQVPHSHGLLLHHHQKPTIKQRAILRLDVKRVKPIKLPIAVDVDGMGAPLYEVRVLELELEGALVGVGEAGL